MKFIAVTSLILLSVSGFAADKVKKHKDGEPCVDPLKNLQVLDKHAVSNFRKTASALSAKEHDYPADKLIGLEAYEICGAIRTRSDDYLLEAMLDSYANRRGISVPDLINNVLAKQECDEMYKAYSIVTYAMIKDHENFKSIASRGLDLYTPIRDTDGEMRLPYDLAMKKRKEATSSEEKKVWQRVRGIIRQLE